MAKWVTFHDSIMGGVQGLKIHNSKEEATQYFKNNYRNYFELSSKVEVKLPMTYGYPHRKFVGMSKQSFEKKYGKIEVS